MTWSTTYRGHIIFNVNGAEEWYYEDGTLFTKDERPCTECGIEVGFDDPDPCLGMLPGVKAACCGHGDESYEYVLTEDGSHYESVEDWREARLV